MIQLNGKDLEFAVRVVHMAKMMEIEGKVIRSPNDLVYKEAKALYKAQCDSEIAVQMNELCANWLKSYLNEKVLS